MELNLQSNYVTMINTDEISDDNSDCCDMNRYPTLYCKHGNDLDKQCEDLKNDCNTFYEMLVALGIENPYNISLKNVKKIAGEDYPFVEGSPIDSGIEYYYKEYKNE